MLPGIFCLHICSDLNTFDVKSLGFYHFSLMFLIFAKPQPRNVLKMFLIFRESEPNVLINMFLQKKRSVVQNPDFIDVTVTS